MKIQWIKASFGGYVATLPTGEQLHITLNAFGSKKTRLRGDGAVGQALFGQQFYHSIQAAKLAAEKEHNKKSPMSAQSIRHPNQRGTR